MGAMRILRGLSSRFLACGCLAGVYETYDGRIVTLIDVPGSGCGASHTAGKIVPIEVGPSTAEVPVRSTSSSRL